MDEANQIKSEKKGVLGWLRKRLVPLASFLGALAIVAIVGVLYLRYPDFFKNLQSYRNRELIGYGVTFVISVFLNATIIIPVSAMAVMMALGAILPSPLVVGLIGGIGAGIGEMTGYMVGRSGRELLARNKIYTRVENWVKKWGWIAIFILSIFPVLFDVVGIIAGAMRMPVWKFFLACWLGRTVIYVTVAYLAHLGVQVIPSWFS
jgi:membrane protein YqaA with SNARE-associated domain